MGRIVHDVRKWARKTSMHSSNVNRHFLSPGAIVDQPGDVDLTFV